MALEAVQRIDALFAIEREINGLSADERKAARQNQSVPLLASLEAWMRNERAKLSRHNHVAKAMDYILKRWDAFFPLPRGRTNLPFKQRRRKGDPWFGFRT